MDYKEKANMHLEIVRLNKKNIELKKENEEMKNLIEIQYQENQTLGNNNAKLLNMFGELKAKLCLMRKWIFGNFDLEDKIAQLQFIDEFGKELTE